MDNLKELRDSIDTVVPINGGIASVKTINDNPSRKLAIEKLGRYTGFPFISKRSPIDGIVPSGTLFWNGNAMNKGELFDIYIAINTQDGNQIQNVVETLNEGSLIHFKDFVGRSALLEFKSFVREVSGAIDYLIITVKGNTEDIDYAYQIDDEEPCMVEFISNAKNAGNSKILNNIEELKATAIDKEIFVVLGYYEANDGGGGEFYYDQENELDDDGGLIISHDTEDGKFIRICGNTLDVKCFGVKKNTVYNEGTEVWDGDNDVPYLENALKSGKYLHFSKGTYKLQSGTFTDNEIYDFKGLYVNSNCKITGDGEETVLVMVGAINGTAGTYFNAFNMVNVTNVSIDKIKVIGEKLVYEDLLTFSEANVGIHIFGEDIKNIKVSDCICEYILGHGIQDNSEISHNEYYRNKTNYCSQNGMNVNGIFAKVIDNYGRGNGFGLLEAGCGSSLIKGNVAEFNVNAGITVGGYNAEETNGHGNNNIIVGNICNNNVQKGLNITIGVVDSIIANNTLFKNGQFGLIVYEFYDKQSNNLVCDNNIFDNGTEGGIGKQGVFINSNGNLIQNNNIYNTEEATATLDKQDYGINIEFNKVNNVIRNNNFKNITTKEIYVSAGCDNTTIETNENDRIFIAPSVKLRRKNTEEVISYNGFPIELWHKNLYADNVSSSKSAILPDAEFYQEGQPLLIFDKHGTAGTHNITFAPITGQKINGVVDDIITINTNYGSVKLIADGVDNWIIL